MAEAAQWLEEFKQFWSASFDQLDHLLRKMKTPPKKRKRK
jgi:hypothetical protein